MSSFSTLPYPVDMPPHQAKPDTRNVGQPSLQKDQDASRYQEETITSSFSQERTSLPRTSCIQRSKYQTKAPTILYN
ncbi:hypothetical protein BCIN_03g00740 [Botrytis cinerea B05.10]|uniref:Uncharacterized protein n=1 Tax=Botryotinia fuckeliana (strain B05.10) TaxID=332648 RepID=A0A384JAU4_BOTFB|nr:hypothetical protein BCIN_03g00740 [Botrytis cinerea B05.10]ATZ47768.1 hypothetical protein BCIN_03g00740 [Botrytis cinerea B05.10]